MTKHRPTLHERLDGDENVLVPPTSAEQAELARYRGVLNHLQEESTCAPDGFVESVMSALPERKTGVWVRVSRALWPEQGPWLGPALAGAAAMLLLFIGVGRIVGPPRMEQVSVTFEFHAPNAEQVELVGSFNDWRPGHIHLIGPDVTGHWTATVDLPAGRHEYVFVVDGQEWVADPTAVLQRPDGFGRMNAVLDL